VLELREVPDRGARDPGTDAGDQPMVDLAWDSMSGSYEGEAIGSVTTLGPLGSRREAGAG
jgi:hypothetical protein